MRLSYNYSQYITKAMMSSKQTILVEGRHDKAHLKNLISKLFDSDQRKMIAIDTAEQIKGESKQTCKNNRVKITNIYERSLLAINVDNLFFLCDREFDNFSFDKIISDIFIENNSSLYFTAGHSFENYFLTESTIVDALSCQTVSEFKPEAIDIFKNNFSNIFEIISCITLTARDLGISSYPSGTIYWDSFKTSNEEIIFDLNDWSSLGSLDPKRLSFRDKYNEHKPLVIATDTSVRISISRGHTAVIMLQRIFAYCLFLAGKEQDEDLARIEATQYSKISEVQITASLSQTWLNSIIQGAKNYPVALLENLLVA